MAIFGYLRSVTFEPIYRDVNKATDSKAKAKAEADAEASVPWHKLVIMHNFFKLYCNTFNLSVSDASV